MENFTEHLSDIEALALHCRTDQAKAYISEAILSYAAGAYRSAIVSTWIAVVFDLIDKINELSLAGDAKASAQKKKYDNYIDQIERGNYDGEKSASNFERNILEICKNDLQLLDIQQYTDLERLRKDRCRCAHPSFQMSHGTPYKPSAEQARLHVRNAIVYVLSQPPVQGKVALEKLKSSISSDYFPTNTDKVIEQFKHAELKNASDSLIRASVDMLVLNFIDKKDPLYNQEKVIASINAIQQLHPNPVEDRLKKQLNKIILEYSDDLLFITVYLSVKIDDGWRVLNEPSKEKIKQLILNGKAEEVTQIFEDLAKNNEIRTIVTERLNSLTVDELEAAINNNLLPTLSIDAVFQHLANTSDWNVHNAIIRKIILPRLSQYDPNNLKQIINLRETTNIDGAFAYTDLILRTRAGSILSNDELLELLGREEFDRLFPTNLEQEMPSSNLGN